MHQSLPQDIGKEARQDVGQDARLTLMPDWADRQLTLVDAEGGLGLGELDVGPPQRQGSYRFGWKAAIRCGYWQRRVRAEHPRSSVISEHLTPREWCEACRAVRRSYHS